MEQKNEQRNELLCVFIQGEEVFIESKPVMTETEFCVLLGVLDEFCKMVKKGKQKCLN